MAWVCNAQALLDMPSNVGAGEGRSAWQQHQRDVADVALENDAGHVQRVWGLGFRGEQRWAEAVCGSQEGAFCAPDSESLALRVRIFRAFAAAEAAAAASSSSSSSSSKQLRRTGGSDGSGF
jgi:hypothetical protein